MKNVIEYLEKQPKFFVISLGVVMLAIIGIFDYLTGYKLGLSIFYLLPIVMVTWTNGRNNGLLMCVAGAIVWLIADTMARLPDVNHTIVHWNAGIRLGYFLIIAYMLSKLKTVLTLQRQLAKIDYLTQLVNSRFFYELASMELNRMLRHKRTFSAAYIDIDNFKVINDTFGHETGNALLKSTAQVIKNSSRKTDIVARLGGDEFIILMPETNREQAQILINRVQKNLNNFIRQNECLVTFSIGVVIYTQAPSSIDELISLADSQMYVSKKSGKNMTTYKVYDHKDPRKKIDSALTAPLDKPFIGPKT
ncbi:MAG: GGDEF domain-containing protein [Candidatus Omnitrophica bacterium]|nr:GGDEF domain-containing protein [Candidatus Omnitrophota bacterium]